VLNVEVAPWLEASPLADRVVIKPSSVRRSPRAGSSPRHRQGEAQEGSSRRSQCKYNERTGERIKLDVAVGDRVMYAKYAGSEVKMTMSTTSSCPRRTFSPSSRSRPEPEAALVRGVMRQGRHGRAAVARQRS